MTQIKFENEQIEKAKQEVEHINNRTEQIKQLLPRYIKILNITKLLYKGNYPRTTISAIDQLKFEFLSNQKLDTPNNIKQTIMDTIFLFLFSFCFCKEMTCIACVSAGISRSI